MLQNPNFSIRASLAALFAACSLSPLQADPIALLPEATVDSHGIFLDEIVSSTDKGSLANIQLASAPKWGQTRTLSRSEVLTLISTAAPLIPTNNISGAEEIRISRHSRLLDESEFLEMLTEKLQPRSTSDRDGTLQLSLMRKWTPVPVPLNPIELIVLKKPGSGLSSRFSVTFELRSDGENVGRYTSFLEASLFREVWVAQSSIRRGTPLDQADLLQEPKNIINLRVAAWTDPVLDPALHFVEGVPTGAVVFARAIRLRPVIQRNQYVQAVFSDGSISISTKVQALESGAPGDLIRARNIRTRKEVHGEVINETTIKVHL